MIRWGRIPGLDDTAREMVALMARCHRKDASRVKELINASPLPKDIRAQLRRMTALLRVADSLDTDHRSRVEQVVCTRMGDAVVLDLVVRDGPSRDDPRLVRKTDLFKEELGLDVRVTIARPVAAPSAELPASPTSPSSSGELRVVRHRAN
jgi:exopolyphosphatase/guanosine-5'-triphosphate,3'-diphosphate pyrophosphatase